MRSVTGGGTGRRDAGLDDYFRRLGTVELLSADEERCLARMIEEGRAADGLLAERSDMGSQERARLEATARAGAAARDRLVEANLRLVIHIAARMPRAHHADLADMIQDGNVGLVRAIDGFDWRRGHRFSTYGTVWVRQAIQRGVARSGRTIRLPYALHDAGVKIAAARTQLQAQTGREPTVHELAEATNLEEVMVRRAQETPPDAVSMHRLVGEGWGPRELSDFVAIARDCPEQEATDRLTITSIVHTAAKTLDPRSWRVLRLRFGLEDGTPMSYADVAADVGLSHESIRLIMNRALQQLRATLQGAA